MNRLGLWLVIGLFGLLALCGMLTALTSAGASLANGAAQAASATALLTSQCISAFMVLVAILAGVGIGVGGMLVRNANQQKYRSSLPSYPTHQLPATWERPWLLPTGQKDDDESDALTQAIVGLLGDYYPEDSQL